MSSPTTFSIVQHTKKPKTDLFPMHPSVEWFQCNFIHKHVNIIYMRSTKCIYAQNGSHTSFKYFYKETDNGPTEVLNI